MGQGPSHSFSAAQTQGGEVGPALSDHEHVVYPDTKTQEGQDGVQGGDREAQARADP